MAEEIKLPPDTLEKLREGNATLKEVEKFLRKAGIAGYDIEQPKKDIEKLKSDIRKTRDGFFPGEEV